MDTVGLSFAAAGAFALILERIIEVVIDPLVPPQYKKWIVIPALALGILGAFAFGLDVIGPLMASLGQEEMLPWVGKLFTGLAIGGGSNLVHDLWPGSRKGRERVEFFTDVIKPD